MKVKVIWNSEDSTKLFNTVHESLEELGLSDFIEKAKVDNEEEIKSLQKEVEITKFPALMIEEEAIEFKDIIFEGMLPEKQEITQMFVSIVGGSTGGWCGGGSCGSCSSDSCGV